MFAYAFMVNAFLAGGIVAVVAGATGWFLVLRGETFAGHALSHVGFAGAAGAGLLGLAPLVGLIGFTVAGGVAIGLLGPRVSGRDVAIGVVLAFSLGLGLLFLSLQGGFAGGGAALLFGNVFAVSPALVAILAALGLVTLAGLAAILRPLLFASLQPELAEAKGVPLRLVAILFLALAAIAIAVSAQIVGVLMVFALMVAPPAAAHRIAGGVWPGLALAAALALASAWLGLTVAYYTDWPASFAIAAVATAIYALSLAFSRRALTRPIALG